MDGMSDISRVQSILQDYDKDLELYSRFCAEVERLIRDLLRISNIPISSVTSRLKKRNSLERKVKRHDKY